MSKVVKKLVDPFGLTKKLLGDDKKAKLAKPETMPDPDDKEAAKSAMREAQRRKRSGRTSTILSDSSNLG